MEKKKTLGKQKIEMKKIENVKYRYTTFTKRRAGLFKKAAQLCLQTGADMVALVTSPGNHTFAFSSQPNPDDLLRHVIPGKTYVGPTFSSQPNPDDLLCHVIPGNTYVGPTSPTSTSLLDHNHVREYRNLTAAEEEEGDRRRRPFWWEEEIDVERMGKEELESYVRALEEVKSNVENILMEKKKSSNINNHGGVEKILMEKGYVCFS